jgi:DNA-binding IclR family transcriptional regulator
MEIEKNPKESVIDMLKKHPEGLTFQKIAMLMNTNELAISKHILELIREGKVYQRNVGIVRLCYLKEEAEQQSNNKE